jgi:hypothetical protein
MLSTIPYLSLAEPDKPHDTRLESLKVHNDGNPPHIYDASQRIHTSGWAVSDDTLHVPLSHSPRSFLTARSLSPITATPKARASGQTQAPLLPTSTIDSSASTTNYGIFATV